jgi:hypothetical protein
MGWLADLFDISLDRANQFYTLGWRLSAVGALVTMTGVALLWWGTRVRDHDFEEKIATLNAATGSSKERTAALEVEAARLRLELDREIQKRAQRILTDEQRLAFREGLKDLKEIALVTQHDIETEAFAFQILTSFPEGLRVYGPKPPGEDKWFAPAGLVMYSPAGRTEEQLKDDPLYRTLKAANLFGGLAGQPFLSLDSGRTFPPAVIAGYAGHVLYVGQKSPF